MEIKDHMPHAYARRLAGKVARHLRDRYGAKKVMLIGTLATGLFNPDFSDIKVGFEGVQNGLESDAVADIRSHFGERDPSGIHRLDVVNLSSLPKDERKHLLGESEEI
jgi:predicted nucleotidyltransferase